MEKLYVTVEDRPRRPYEASLVPFQETQVEKNGIMYFAFFVRTRALVRYVRIYQQALV